MICNMPAKKIEDKTGTRGQRTGRQARHPVCIAKFVNETEFLYNVEYEYNGVTVQAAFADQQFFFGKGAGGHPTGSAVLSDIAALRYDYQYEYKKAKGVKDLQFTNNVEVNIYLRYDDEALVEALEFEHIQERFYSGNYKFVIGK
jgi:homoserine dehydrogenase